MNLDFGTEYDSFRDEVREFCDRYKGVQVTGSLFQYLEVTNSNSDEELKISAQEWQKILIEKGYFARHIPKEFGGYGG
ncbi:MAG: acyl-CoA dehydrogenase, partial [Rhodospirillaceae bacterium]|nr:acyl-CoA dehydrogenase [Rhodospirillaceae bacterium]